MASSNDVLVCCYSRNCKLLLTIRASWLSSSFLMTKTPRERCLTQTIIFMSKLLQQSVLMILVREETAAPRALGVKRGWLLTGDQKTPHKCC